MWLDDLLVRLRQTTPSRLWLESYLTLVEKRSERTACLARMNVRSHAMHHASKWCLGALSAWPIGVFAMAQVPKYHLSMWVFEMGSEMAQDPISGMQRENLWLAAMWRWCMKFRALEGGGPCLWLGNKFGYVLFGEVRVNVVLTLRLDSCALAQQDVGRIAMQD